MQLRGLCGRLCASWDLKDEELYTREAATDEGRRTKRSGGRIFAVECYTLRNVPGELRPELIITGRHIMRRLGLIEDRELKKRSRRLATPMSTATNSP